MKPSGRVDRLYEDIATRPGVFTCRDLRRSNPDIPGGTVGARMTQLLQSRLATVVEAPGGSLPSKYRWVGGDMTPKETRKALKSRLPRESLGGRSKRPPRKGGNGNQPEPYPVVTFSLNEIMEWKADAEKWRALQDALRKTQE